NINGISHGTVLLIDNVSVIKSKECDLLFDLELPNVITPNSDGINEIIDISVESKTIQTHVYNRWGNLVSEFAGNKIYWNGKCNDENCSDGVYYMIVQYEMNGKPMIKQTFIHLV